MVDARTIEDLAMSMMAKRHPIMYNEKVLPVFETVRGVVEEFFALRGGAISYGMRYKEDCALESLDAEDIALQLETALGLDIPNQERGDMHTIYGTVLFFVRKRRDGDQVGNLMEAYRRLSLARRGYSPTE